MKMQGVSENAAKLRGLATLLCCVLLLTALGGVGKLFSAGKAKSTVTAAKEAAKPVAASNALPWAEAYGKLPLSFEENQGQTAREVRYLSHGPGYEVFLTSQEAVVALRPNKRYDLTPLHCAASLRAIREARKAEQLTAIRMRLEGANPDRQIVGIDPLPGKANYFIGNNPKNWHTGVPSYAQVKYAGVYPGVDLVFYGNQRHLEYDFVVAPGANPKAIQLQITGARKMRINSRGELVLRVPGGKVELQKPLIYQQVDGQRREIAGRYAISQNSRVTFLVASYDRSQPLILDPVLNYSTYLGGSADDGGFAIAVDAAGDAFVAGQTMSTDFPHPAGTNGAVSPSPTPNMGASFVAELNPAGTQLLYSTYLAGTTSNPSEQAFGVAVDTSGKVYVTGLTFATNFPTTSNALKSSTSATNANGTSYIAKLDPTMSGTASLLYSSYLGGTVNGGDVGQSIAVDSSNPANGIVYVAGYTDSTPGTAPQNFPVVNGYQTTLNCPTNGNAFLAKIDTTKSGAASLIYSTYLGGACAHIGTARFPFGEVAFGVAADASGKAYLAGLTSSTDFPTFGNAHQPNPPAGNTMGTAFLTKIDTTLTGTASGIYSTYLGGATFDLANAIALGPSNVAYIAGLTDSNDFPVSTGAFDTSGAGTSGKAFVSLIDTTLAAVPSLKYSTFLGGSGGDAATGIKADSSGNAYVAGTTSSTNFPFPPKAMIIGGFEPTYPSGALQVGFFSKLNPAGGGTSDLLYSTYFGGVGSTASGDHIYAIAIDSSNPANAYMIGQTFSSAATFPVFPTTAPTAFQTTLNGPSDAFVAKLTPIPTLSVAPTSLNFGTILIPNTSAPQTVAMTNNTNANIAFTSATLTGANAADFMATSGASCSPIITPAAPCTVSVTFKPSVVGAEAATLVLTDGDSTSPQNISLSGTGTNVPPDFGLTGPTATQTVTDGQSVSFQVTATAMGGFNSQVALSCTSAPTLTLGTCTASPATVTPTAAGVTSTITVTTTALLLPPSARRDPPISPRQIVPLLLATMLFLLLPRLQRLRLRLATVAAMIVLVALAGCSGTPKPSTPKGPYVLTITGTSTVPAQTHTVTVNLSVQ